MMNEGQYLTVRPIPDGPNAADYSFFKRLREPGVLAIHVRHERVSREDALAAKIPNTSSLNALGPGRLELRDCERHSIKLGAGKVERGGYLNEEVAELPDHQRHPFVIPPLQGWTLTQAMKCGMTGRWSV